MAKKNVTQTEPEANVCGTEAEAVVVKAPTEHVVRKVRTEIDPNAVITVKNGFPGVLVYISKKTGEQFVWQEYGAEQELEFSELKNARNSSKAFFENNWFLIDDPSVLDALGVAEYYKYASKNSGFEKLFEKTPSEIKRDVSTMTDGQKRTVAYRARSLISAGELDSIKKISALEDALGITLIER